MGPKLFISYKPSTGLASDHPMLFTITLTRAHEAKSWDRIRKSKYNLYSEGYAAPVRTAKRQRHGGFPRRAVRTSLARPCQASSRPPGGRKLSLRIRERTGRPPGRLLPRW